MCVIVRLGNVSWGHSHNYTIFILFTNDELDKSCELRRCFLVSCRTGRGRCRPTAPVNRDGRQRTVDLRRPGPRCTSGRREAPQAAAAAGSPDDPRGPAAASRPPVSAQQFFQRLSSKSSRYGDGAGNTTEENSSVFSLIRMC